MTSEQGPFVPVPQEPTQAMMQATLPTVRSIANLDQETAGRVVRAVYDLMLETAPPPPGDRLTDNQHKVLAAVCELFDKTRKIPAHKAVAERTGFSRSYVSTVINALVRRGYLRPAPRGKRKDGQGYSKKRGYSIAIRAELYRS